MKNARCHGGVGYAHIRELVRYEIENQPEKRPNQKIHDYYIRAISNIHKFGIITRIGVWERTIDSAELALKIKYLFDKRIDKEDFKILLRVLKYLGHPSVSKRRFNAPRPIKMNWEFLKKLNALGKKYLIK